MIRDPLVAYADFESILKPMTDIDTTTGIYDAKQPKKERRQVRYQKHKPISYFTLIQT